jgi:hypothetical protein
MSRLTNESAKILPDSKLSDQSKFASVFYCAQAVKRQLDAFLTIPDQIVVQNRYKLLCSDPLPGTVVENLVF